MATTREIVRALNRQRALSGESLDPFVAEGIVRGGLREESDRSLKSRGIALQERALDEQIKFRDRQQENAELAGKISAGVNIGALYSQHKVQGRALDIAERRALSQERMVEGLFGAGTAGSAGAANLATVVNPFEATGAVPASSQIGANVLGGAEAGTAVAGAAPSFLATAGAGAAGALVGSQFGKGKGKQLAAGAGSAIATALITSNPYTIAIAGVASFLGVGDDKVICSELNRHGYIGYDILTLDCIYSIMWVDTPTHVGYRLLADRIVPYMRSSKCLRMMIAPFGIAWAHAMAEKVDNSVTIKYWHRYLGNILMKTITPICRWYGRRSLNG